MTSGLLELPPSTRQALLQPMDKADICQDVVGSTDGFAPKYPAAPAIIRRLNEVFGAAWSNEIVSTEISPDRSQVIVLVRLSVYAFGADGERFSVRHDGYGQSRLKTANGLLVDYGYDLKAACTDGLRKAATLFGISLELYEKDESAFQGLDKMAVPPTEAAQPAPDFQINRVVEMMDVRFHKPWQEWCKALNIANPGCMTIEQATAILSGTHPYIVSLNGGQATPSGMTGANA